MPVCQQFRKDITGVSIRHTTVNGNDIIKLWLGSHDNNLKVRQWLQNILDPTKYQDRPVYVHHKLTLNGASPKNFLPSVLAKGAIECNTPLYMPTSLAPMRFSSSALPLFISFSFSDTPAPRIPPLLSGLDCSLGIGQPLMAVIGGNQGTWPPSLFLCGTGNFLLGFLGHSDSRGNVAGSVCFSLAVQVLVLCHSDGEDVVFVGICCFLLCDGGGGGGGGGAVGGWSMTSLIRCKDFI